MMSGAGQASLVRLLQTAENVAIRTQDFSGRRSSGSACVLYSTLRVLMVAWTVIACIGTPSAQTAGVGSQADAVDQMLAVYKQLLSAWAGLPRYGSETS